MSNRLVLTNAIFTYSQSVISAIITIFSSRWVLEALGDADYGIYSLNGSIILFVTFINTIMSGSISRYFAYSIGTRSKEEVVRWFNLALLIHIAMPILVIILGYFIGSQLIREVFIISSNRIQSSLYVFYFSLFSAFWGMVSIPFIAMFTAKQHFRELAICRLFQSVLIFFSAYLLSLFSSDKLVVYALLMSCSISIVLIIQIVRAFSLFPECTIVFAYWKDYERLKSLFSYSFWVMFGNLGHLLRTQGMAFLVNIKFGTIGNAALGIANNVSAQTSVFANSLSNAVAPEIISQVGAGNLKQALSSSMYANKIGIYLMLIFAVPLLVEMDNILNLWLVKPPINTAILCRCFIVMFVIEKITMGLIPLLEAIGKIARIQIWLGMTNGLTILFALLLINWGMGIESVGLSCIIMMLLSRFSIISDAIKYFKIERGGLIRIYLLIIPILFSLALLFSYYLSKNISDGVFRLFLNSLSTFLLITALSYRLLLTSGERIYLVSKLYLFCK